MPKTYHVPAKPRNDNEHLELIARIIFIIGFNYKVVESRWPQIKKAFHNFDIEWVKKVNVEKLVKAPGMIKNRKKIETIIHNANECFKIIKEFGSMKKWLASIVKENRKSPLLTPTVAEECQRIFKGIGETTRNWVAYVFVDGKHKPEIKVAE